ncbi:MAG: FAD-dependent monooxygenase [Burkholderiaceae bacterium]
MRPAGRGPLESLYFDYPVFEAAPVPTGDHGPTMAPVLIVGAGPIGMMAALELARHGTRSVLIERKTTFNDGSRAICIARQSMQMLDQVGAVAPFLAKALGWTRGRSFYRGREILCFDMPHAPAERYLPMYNLQQQYIEQYLWDAVSSSALIDARWGTELLDLAQGDGQVTASLRSEHGSYRQPARYLLAADGARSAVRQRLGLRLQGENHEGRYVIADVQMRHDYPTERRALFHPDSNPGATVLIHRQPDDLWRIDYQLQPGEDPEAAVQEAAIRTRVGAILAEIGHRDDWALEWWSIYTANTLCLDDYRHGRVFFIGDAAHIVPIFGVRGLNNGLADAQNIGWKLARVLDGTSPDSLLDSYSVERRGATLDVFANASRSARFMTPPTRGHELMRDAVLSLSVSHGFARELANPRQMTPYTYADSPLASPQAGDDGWPAAVGSPVGAACLNARVQAGSFLLDHAGSGFTAVLGARPGDGPRLARLLSQGRAIDAAFRVLHVHAPGAVDVVDPGEVTDSCRRLVDVEGELLSRLGLGEGALMLLRPDLHVAGRWRNEASAPWQQVLRSALGKDAE